MRRFSPYELLVLIIKTPGIFENAENLLNSRGGGTFFGVVTNYAIAKQLSMKPEHYITDKPVE